MANFCYLYCLKDLSAEALALPKPSAKRRSAQAGKNQPKFSLKGMDKKRVSTLTYKNIEAVITEVNSKEFEPKKVKAKLEKDLKWTEEKVRNHQAVIEEAMKISTVIPLKFLTLYKTKEKIKQVLKKKYNEFQELLGKLKDKEEWGLKVYLTDKEKLTGAIKKEDEGLIKMEKEIAEKPEGVKYFLKKKTEQRIKEKFDEQLDNYIKEIFEILSPFSIEKPVVNKLLPVELTSKAKELSLKEMILNISCLVPKEKVGEFQKTVERIHNHIYFPKGLWLEYSGPWPPYSFVTDIEHGNQNKESN